MGADTQYLQGRSLLPLLAGCRPQGGAGWRKAILLEYWAESAYPWLVGMTYKAVRTDRHKYIHWVTRGHRGEFDELYDLDQDPYEIANLVKRPAHRRARPVAPRKLRRLVTAAIGL